MNVRALMTPNPACCTPATTVREAARLMVEHDCGEIPVVRADDDRTLVGVITDRDIVCRVVAKGKDPAEMSVEHAMSTPVVTVTEDASLDDTLKTMELHQIRRVPVVDARGTICGIVSQADIAIGAPPQETAELVREVSRA